MSKVINNGAVAAPRSSKTDVPIKGMKLSTLKP